MKLANRLNAFSEYPFSLLLEKVAEIEKTTGEKVLNLGVGSPDFPPSIKYLEKLQELILHPNGHLYPGYKAIPELTDALIKSYKNRFNITFSSDELLPLLGAKDGVVHISMALLDEGDEVLIPNPGYPSYTGSAKLIGAKPVYYNPKLEDDLQKLITAKTKFMWVNYPNNPTGFVIDKSTLEKLYNFAKDSNIYLIYDNAYEAITFDGYKAISPWEIPGMKDVCVEINSFSKSHSFAGFRMGWAIGNKEIIKALTQVKGQVDSGMMLGLQKLATFSINHPDNSWQEAMLKSYQNKRDIIAEKLLKLGCTFELQKASLYIWAKIPTKYKSSKEFCDELLKTNKVFVTPGTVFGSNGEGYIRASICANIENIDKHFK